MKDRWETTFADASFCTENDLYTWEETLKEKEKGKRSSSKKKSYMRKQSYKKLQNANMRANKENKRWSIYLGFICGKQIITVKPVQSGRAHAT